MKQVEKMTMSNYNRYVDSLIKRKKTFEVTMTSYTRRLKIGDKTILFSSDFEGDNFYLLPLINKVRIDAKKYMLKNNTENKSPIDFFSLINNPRTKKVICKIDLNGAYWNFAIKNDIISESTNNFLRNSHLEKTYKELKSSRLKSLGSLATRKLIYYYEDGVEIEEKREHLTEFTRSLYIDICRGIDDLMKECCNSIEGCIYYYWDCIFVDKEFSNDAVEFMKKKKYDVTIEETTIDVVSFGDVTYLLSMKDEKMYLIKKEDKHLLYE